MGMVCLCVWLLLSEPGQVYAGNEEFTVLCVLSIPALAMMHAQISNEGFDAHRPARTAVHWLSGCFVQPFSAIPKLASPLQIVWNAKDRETRNTVMRVTVMSILVGIPVLGILTALLSSADSIFRQGVTVIFGDLDLSQIIVHMLIIGVLTICCYSLLWNCESRNVDPQLAHSPVTRAGTMASKTAKVPVQTEYPYRNDHRPFNPTVCLIVLTSVLALYLAFIAVQCTFLFARQGLPDGYTYAEYAREGFWQLLAVTGLNLIGFGLVLTYSPRKRALDAMLLGLIAATAVVLVSSAVRLNLYIDAYGLTWLRLASMLFIVLLAVMLLLCIARLRFAGIPMLTLCAALAVFWFVCLGYLNPSALITAYNQAHGFTTMPTL
jgi:hypothetical protein